MLRSDNLLSELVDNSLSLVKSGYYTPRSEKPGLKLNQKSFNILAELKIASPLGLLSSFDINEQIYRLEYADGISIITEPNYFRGSIEYLDLVSSTPILMKDIIIHEKQIDSAGPAATILLIKRVLDEIRLEELLSYAHKQNRDVILEVDNLNDFISSNDTQADFLAINNRNLADMSINKTNAIKILNEFSPNIPTFAFSGYADVEEIIKVRDAGAAGVLIGSLFSSVDPRIFIQQLRDELK